MILQQGNNKTSFDCTPVVFPYAARYEGLGDGYTLAGGELRDGDGDIIATRTCDALATGTRAMMLDRSLSDTPESSPQKQPRLTEPDPDADEFETVTDSETD